MVLSVVESWLSGYKSSIDLKLEKWNDTFLVPVDKICTVYYVSYNKLTRKISLGKSFM